MRLNLTTDRTEQSSRTLPFVEAAKNLIRTVVEGDDKRQVESFASLARRMRSWEKFKQAAKDWCKRHSEC